MFTGARCRTVLGWGFCGCLLAGCLSGCGKDAPADPAQPPKLAVQSAAADQPAVQTPTPQAAPSGPNQTFFEATVHDVPEDQRLPEETKTHKSVGKLYEQVVAEWAKVPFITPDGQKLSYTATITTDLGLIKIELWPDVAPNHVRNFIALARVGYYDGLEFDRAVKREREDGRGDSEYLEAGCPLGTGEMYYGSIGYWLRPEFHGGLPHDAGTVGACHGADVESAACKFYINLNRAEWMDGNFTLFGKVTQGLEVVRAIHRRPVRDDELRDRPVEPVVMRSVTIACGGR